MIGYVSKWSNTHGQISVHGQDEDIFVHRTALQNCNELTEGDYVEFEVSRVGTAINVKLIETKWHRSMKWER